MVMDGLNPPDGANTKPDSAGLGPVRSRAWQPFTWRGVASFAPASFTRLLVVQLLVALLVAAAVIWFLDHTWFPTIREGIRQLPEVGLIENQQLLSPRLSTEPLVENPWLAFVVDAWDAGTPAPASDIRVEFKRRRVDLCSFPGCLPLDYPAGYVFQFNRPELESWWAAWEPTIYAGTALATVAVLFVTWIFLATIYCPFVRLFGFFKDRAVTLAGSWKISAASLLPAALLVGASLVLYGFRLIDLIGLVTLWLLHLPMSWVYLAVSPLRLPRVSDAVPSARRDPFGAGRASPRPSPNPFNPGDAPGATASLASSLQKERGLSKGDAP